MDPLAIVGGVIAVYGAALSSWVAIHQRSLTRYQSERLVSVRGVCDEILDDQGQLHRLTISVKAVNERPRPIQIEDGGFSDVEGDRLYLDPLSDRGTPMPATLHDGEGCTIHFGLRDVMLVNKTVGALDGVWVTDASGTIWTGPLTNAAKQRMEPDPTLPRDRWFFEPE